ncbi:MAG: response regulator [Polyangiaceae bacterium]|jgi:CheY-like chemotaxis protein
MARILVLDDDPAISHLYARWLGDQHEVLVQNDSGAALAAIEAGQRFDAIVCDVHMPGVSGFQVHAAIARVDADQARRMVFVTAGPVRVAPLPGTTPSNPLLFKPFPIEELRSIVDGFAAGPATSA